ncbi:homing endonuclease associated repeat-containing protein [Halococcus hamelinensis]|uniref:homing endonuclease associated repeat-containing protein n=1 Tax=Halococcus hamelinensis TaxID=332168 RepID=UPI000AE46149
MPYSEEELLDELDSLADDLGRTPHQRDVNDRESVPSSTTYYHRFGSWSDV